MGSVIAPLAGSERVCGGVAMTQQPTLIICTGPSGAGKSALAERLAAIYPIANVDDVVVIEEYLRLEQMVAEACDPAELRAQLAGRFFYIDDVREAYLRDLDLQPERIPALRHCTRGQTGLAISDPGVWDQAVIRLARSLDAQRRHIVQVARGHDSRQLLRFGLEEHEVYPRTIELLLAALPPPIREGVGVVHVTAPYPRRCQRNEARRAETGQYVPAEVMKNVFERDVFTLAETTRTSRDLTFGVVVAGGRRLPAVVFKNDNEYSDEPTRREVLEDAACKALQYLWSSMT